MDNLLFLTQKYLEKIALLVGLFVLSGAVVLFLNFENIKLVQKENIVINSTDDYKLDTLKSNTKVTINGTINNLFKSKQNAGGRDVHFFALREYIFDFILISDKEFSEAHTYSCMDVSEQGQELLASLINKFNSPIELSVDQLENNNILNNESRDTLLQNTKGNFGTATRLLNCAQNVEKSELELYFVIFVEIMFLFLGLVFLLRHIFLDFIEDLYEDLQ